VKVAVAGGGAEVELPQVRVGAFEREVAVEAIAQIDAHTGVAAIEHGADVDS
jgi:hypothetical protein